LTALPFDLKGLRVFIAGHRGMVGSALMRRLAGEDCELVTADRRSLDFTRQAETEAVLMITPPPRCGHAAFVTV